MSEHTCKDGSIQPGPACVVCLKLPKGGTITFVKPGKLPSQVLAKDASLPLAIEKTIAKVIEKHLQAKIQVPFELIVQVNVSPELLTYTIGAQLSLTLIQAVEKEGCFSCPQCGLAIGV